MKLYYMPGACSLADMIVLAWLDVPYTPVRMSLDTMKEPGYLSLCAGGTVPLLEHDGYMLTENVAILGYLADLHPAAGLVGNGTPRGRAEVMRWLGFLNSDVHKAFKPIFSPSRFLEQRDLDDELHANARHHIRLYLERLDLQLSGRGWLTGERSVADAYLFVVNRWAIAKQVDQRGMANLAAFMARMDADAGVKAALAVEAA